jgi:DNA-binding NarL/FixJ family response regulator
MKICRPDVKVIILTMHNEESFILHLMEMSVNGYLIKNADAAEIINAIHCVHETNYYFNELVSKTLLKKIATNNKYKPFEQATIDLTEREVQVLKLICEEKTAIEIGAIMFLSPRTIEGIRAVLLEKVRVKNIAGLVSYAVKSGIVK